MDVLFYERITKRYETNVLIDVRLKTWNPFQNKAAKLLDFSLGGFRIEFIEKFPFKNMENIILKIPMSCIDPSKKNIIKLKAEIKWADPLHQQVGGTYLFRPDTDKEFLEKIIIALAQNNKTEQK
jgi:hypothetical protein